MSGVVKTACTGLSVILTALGLWFVYQTIGFYSAFSISKNQLWDENYDLHGKDAEYEIHTSGDLEWTGLKWDITLNAKFPCSRYEEVVRLNQVSGNEALKLMDQVHYSILVKRSALIDANQSLELKKLEKSDFSSLRPSQIEFLKTQFKKGVYLSLKVVGSETAGGIDCPSLKKSDGSLRNFTYRLSTTHPHVDQEPNSETGKISHHKTFYLTTFRDPGCDHSLYDKPMVIRIPRVHAVMPKTSWYSWFTFSYWFWSTTPIQDSCVLFARSVKDHGHRFVPKAIISFLFCY